MTTILIVEKPGTIRELKVKVFAEEELFKKAGFKSPEGFNTHATWKFPINGNEYSISLYGKTAGKAGQENKYDFPPPVDNKLFFGACVLTGKCNGTIVDLNESMWEKAYEHLFGGFEDLGKDDSDDDEEMDSDDNIPKTKEGYAKDGFIVDDNEDMDEDYEEPKKTKKRKTPQKLKKEKPVVEPVEPVDVFDCTNELEEEEYV